MPDTALGRVARRLTDIQAQIESLRADVEFTDEARRSQTANRPAPAPRLQPQVAERAVPKLDVTADAVSVEFAAVDSAEVMPVSPPPSLESIVSGRGLAVVGALLMLFGCAYFLDLSFTRNWIGPLERILLGLSTGTLLIAFAPRFLRGPYRMAAEAGAGLGAGVIYLSSWAAVAVFPDLNIPRSAAFAAMTAATCALSFIAERTRSQAIGLMGLVGAYLAPMLLGPTTIDRTMLADYLLIVTAGGLALARRRSFLTLEVLTVVATLMYSVLFWPNPFAGWTPLDAAIVATLFFIEFAVASTTRPLSKATPSPLRVVPFIATTFIYLIALEGIWHADQTLLGGALLSVAALLLAAPAAMKGFPCELRPVYRASGVLAFDLALRSLVHGTILLDVFAAQAAVLLTLGARTSHVVMLRAGLTLFAFTAAWLVFLAATDLPAQALATPLAFAFLAWIAAAVSARRALPPDLRAACAIVAHAVLLIGLTRATLDATGGLVWTIALPSVAQCSLSIVWALFAAALFAHGVTTGNRLHRCEALAIFAVTIGKVFTVDLAALDLADRVLAFTGTGVLVFLSSVWYAHSTRAGLSARTAA